MIRVTTVSIIDRSAVAAFVGRGLLIATSAALLAGCAQPPATKNSARSKEFFSSAIYGAASPRVVADGEPVPRGGGQYLVGRPYTVAGRRYIPNEQPRQTQVGLASYYGSAFHGRRTANGEVYDMASISAAHPTMPLPSYVRVTNNSNGRSIIVRVNDRGPFHPGRVMDVSQRVAEALDFRRMGTAEVKIDYLGRAGLEGSDDNLLMASLRTDGRPATLDGAPEAPQTLIARDDAPVRQSPQRVAFAEPEDEAPPPVVAMRAVAMPSHVPLPPSRPFDLGTMPGADVPIRRQVSQIASPRDKLAVLIEHQAPYGRAEPLAPRARPSFASAEFSSRR